jgi:hypothetical protein
MPLIGQYPALKDRTQFPRALDQAEVGAELLMQFLAVMPDHIQTAATGRTFGVLP